MDSNHAHRGLQEAQIVVQFACLLIRFGHIIMNNNGHHLEELHFRLP